MNHATRVCRVVRTATLALGTLALFFACESPLLKEIREASLAPAVLSPIISLSVALPNGNDGQTEVPLDNGTTFPFPSKYLGAAASPVLFRVSNTGTGDLLLTGEDKVKLEGDDGESSFEVSQPPGKIFPGTYEEFSIDFTPSRLGLHTASVTIVSNDPKTPMFTFEITTEATATPIPVIQLIQGSTLIPQDTSEYHFGNVITDGTGTISSGQIVFTILNNGSANLDVSSIAFGSGDSDHFALFGTEPRSVAPGNSTDFGVSFNPKSMGEKSVELRINHNDQENNPTIFALSGTGVAPRISVEGASGEIFHNGLIDFGTVLTGRIAESEVTIHNGGSADLHLTNLPLVVSGTGGSYFSLVNQPASTIAPGAQTSFSIQFTKRYEDQSGPQTATLQIAHDDVMGPNSPFLINLSAQALEWSGNRQIDTAGGRNQILYHHTTHPRVFSIHDLKALQTQIRFGSSDDGGASWTNHTIDLAGNSPRGHMSEKRIAIIYRSSEDLFFTTSTDHGQTWSSKQHIASNVSFHDITGSDHSTRDLLFVSYRDTNTKNVMFLKSEDGGATWEPARTIVESNNDVGQYGAIATERLGTYVFVSYWNHSTKAVEVVGSGDGGANWVQPRVVDSSVAPSISKTDIAVHSSQLGPIVVAYTDTSNNLAFARCSSFHAFFYGFEQDRWSTAVIDSNVDLSADLAIAYNSTYWGENDVYIAYRDYTHRYLYVMKSHDGGVSWLPRKAVDTSGDAGRYPSITIHSNMYNDLVFIGHTSLSSFNYRIVKSKTGGSEW